MYADPNGPHSFGGRAPFLREKLLRVPAGAEPPPDELSEYKKQVQEQQEQIRELQAKYAELRGALERATQTTPAPAASPNVYKYVAVGALGLLAVTLVLLYRETRRDQPRPRVRTSARRKRRRCRRAGADCCALRVQSPGRSIPVGLTTPSRQAACANDTMNISSKAGFRTIFRAVKLSPQS